MDNLVKMYGMRTPYKSELDFFKGRPEVAGMATEDNKIILNPFSSLSPQEKMAVAKNEALRIYMRLNDVSPTFDLTKAQKSMFMGTEYEKDPLSAKQTILARILSGDPSAKDATLDQTLEAQKLQEQIMQSMKK
jgi:hypothetical protein